MIKRELNLPINKDFFLFGPRQTGKSTLIGQTFAAESTWLVNLLLSENYTKYKASPGVFREEVIALPKDISHVVIDEAQRIPELLNEVQFLIDSKQERRFVITGSSARKLKRGQANLLGGRALTFNLYPLTLHELGEHYSLVDILSGGTLPPNVTAQDEEGVSEQLRSYVETYLKEEIELEALSRNIGGFIRFLNVAGQCNGEQLNYSAVSRDVGLSSVTVREYFKVLEDTLLGGFLFSYHRSERKRHKTSPKFYLFDTGVLRAIQRRLSLKIAPSTFEFGNYFETWVINETMRISSYLRKDLNLSFLRTAHDAEVDLIIETPSGKTLGIEIKSKELPISSDFAPGFSALQAINPGAELYCVCTARTPRRVDKVTIIPYADFFSLLRAL